MSFLITNAWLRAECPLQKVTVKPAEVRRALRRQKRVNFENEREYKRFLRRTGLTHRQMLFRVEGDLLAQRLARKVASTAEPVSSRDVSRYIRADRRDFRGLTRQQRRRKARRVLVAGSRQVAVETFLYDFRQRWRALTVCAEGYFVRECGNAPAPPSAAPTSSSASGLRA
jgi:hypothetical protein